MKSQSIRIERSLRSLKFMEVVFVWIFLGELGTNLFPTVDAFANSHFVSTLLSIYSVAFSALIVVYALVAPRRVDLKDRQKVDQHKDLLNKILNVAVISIILIFCSLVFYLPDLTEYFMIGFVILEMAGFPWIFLSMVEILIRLRQIYYIE